MFVLDLEPRWIVPLGYVSAPAMFRNHTFEIALASKLEQALAVSIDVVYAEQELRCPRHDAPQSTLTLD
jgi:hypothetical protein